MLPAARLFTIPKSTRRAPKPLLEGRWRPDIFGQPVTDWKNIDWAPQHWTKSKAMSLPWQINLPSLASAIGNKALCTDSRWNPGGSPEKLLSISDSIFWTHWQFVTPHLLDLTPNQMAPNTSGSGRGPHFSSQWTLRGTTSKWNKPYSNKGESKHNTETSKIDNEEIKHLCCSLESTRPVLRQLCREGTTTQDLYFYRSGWGAPSYSKYLSG